MRAVIRAWEDATYAYALVREETSRGEVSDPAIGTITITDRVEYLTAIPLDVAAGLSGAARLQRLRSVLASEADAVSLEPAPEKVITGVSVEERR